MLYRVTLIFDRGRPRPKHSRAEVLGQLHTGEEWDAARSRHTRVARLFDAVTGVQTKNLLPPLFDAVDLCENPNLRRLTGFERVEDGPLSLATGFQQTWHLVPAFTDDLINAEHRINMLSAELHELRGALASHATKG